MVFFMMYLLKFNSNIDVILYIIEVIGCISFSSSGAIKAIRKKTDILGVWILTLIEIFGGGLLRDLIISNGPPHIFWDEEYLSLALISLIITTIWFLIGYFKKTSVIIDTHRHDFWIYILDAIGMSVFVIYGVQIAYNNLPNDISFIGTYVYVITLGVISGVGGGMFRDLFVGEIPMVFKKHFYMTPCIIGALIYSLLYINNVNTILSIIIGICIITILRFFAIVYKWNLPSAKGYNLLVVEREKENNEERK